MSKKERLHSFSIEYPIRTADTFVRRFWIEGKRDVDYGLLLVPCKSIPHLFMKIPIDVVYLDAAIHIVRLKRT